MQVNNVKGGLVTLFPTQVGIYSLSDSNANRDIELMRYIFNLRNRVTPEGVFGSNVGGWHSESIDLELPSTKWLSHFITSSVKSYLSSCGYGGVPSIDSLWANINAEGDLNLPHCHSSSVISGVYYPAKELINGEPTLNYSTMPSDELVNLVRRSYYNGEGGALCFPPTGPSPFFTKNNQPAGGGYYVTPRAGLLVVFPSSLVHMVLPTNKNKTRVSVAFNVSIK